MIVPLAYEGKSPNSDRRGNPPGIFKNRIHTALQNPSIKRLIRALWLLAILAVIVGSLLPSDSTAIRTLDRLPISDKVEHFGMYAVLAFLPAIHERRSVFLAAAAGAVLLGIGLEFAQLYSGWRDFEVADMLADTIGVALGLAAGLAVRAWVCFEKHAKTSWQ